MNPEANNCKLRGVIFKAPVVQFRVNFTNPSKTNIAQSHFLFGIGVLIQSTKVNMMNNPTRIDNIKKI